MTGPSEPGYPAEQMPAPQPPSPYGQPPSPYGQAGSPALPPMGPVTTQFARVDPGPSQTFGSVSFVISVVGAALVVVAFTVLSWFPDTNTTFRDIHKTLNVIDPTLGLAPEGIAKAYFGWLGWILFAATVLFALLATVPTLGAPFRIAAPAAAIAAIVVTVLSIKIFKDNASLGVALKDYFSIKHARAGFYVAVAGFATMGVGAAIGPQRTSR